MTDGDTWTREDSMAVAKAVRPVMAAVLRLDRCALEDAREELRRYDAAGPLTDPTGWMSGHREANERALERVDALIECYDRLIEASDGMGDLSPEQLDSLGDSQAAIIRDGERVTEADDGE